MNKETFLEYLPIRKTDSHKYQNGVIGLFAGSYGMMGACDFNIVGARCLGASYINVYLPKDIYPLITTLQPACIYHFLEDDYHTSLDKCQALSFGSGMNNVDNAKKYLKELIDSKIDLVIDAFGLRLLALDIELLKNHSQIIVLTPHLGEFAALVKMSIVDIEKNCEEICLSFAKKYNVYLVLKGPDSLIVSPSGTITRNNSGNEVLATAGSGDVLTGILTAMLALNKKDPYKSIACGVWFHGYLADTYIKNHSKMILDFNELIKIADQFFLENGR